MKVSPINQPNQTSSHSTLAASVGIGQQKHPGGDSIDDAFVDSAIGTANRYSPARTSPMTAFTFLYHAGFGCSLVLGPPIARPVVLAIWFVPVTILVAFARGPRHFELTIPEEGRLLGGTFLRVV
jgi:hypothetical protein